MRSSPSSLYGGIEAGGTKFVCAVGTGPGDLREVRFPTTTPEETIARAADFFLGQRHEAPIAALGIGSFGPVDVNPASPTFGYITTTPKPGWAHTDFAGALRDRLGVPVAFDTDVNAAALGEYRWGAGRGLGSLLYLTVGTGIGGGGLVEGRPMHGLVHPEMGHIRIPHDRGVDPFEGCCPFHGDCLEGLASGPAIEARWGRPGETLPEEHEAWDLEARYLALALVNFICTLSPERIIIGGGAMRGERLFGLVRAHVQALLHGYVQHPALTREIDRYIVPPALGARSGVLGALALAALADLPPPEDREDAGPAA